MSDAVFEAALFYQVSLVLKSYCPCHLPLIFDATASCHVASIQLWSSLIWNEGYFDSLGRLTAAAAAMTHSLLRQETSLQEMLLGIFVVEEKSA